MGLVAAIFLVIWFWTAVIWFFNWLGAFITVGPVTFAWLGWLRRHADANRARVRRLQVVHPGWYRPGVDHLAPAGAYPRNAQRGP